MRFVASGALQIRTMSDDPATRRGRSVAETPVCGDERRTFRNVQVVRALVASLCVIALASCGSDGKVLHRGSVQVLVGADDGSNMAGVGLGGTVSLVGDCLGLEEWIVIWPPGTTIRSDDPVTIEVPALGAVEVGDHIEGGGVEYDPEDPPDGIDIPEGCEGSSLVSYFPNQ